jgi:adenylylsulfate kinase-like enzyme
MVILLFGQPASGKTLLADRLVPHFSHNLVRIDGDVWREVTENKDYSKEGRIRNLKGAFDMGIYLSKSGMISLMSFVAPYQELRTYLSSKTKTIQIYLNYKGERGRSNYFAKDFEEPDMKDCLCIDTSEKNVDECIKLILDYINTKI